MLKGAVDHVGHRLKAAVWVPGGAFGLTRAVLDLTHLIHVNEGIEDLRVEAIKGAAHRKAFAFHALRRGRDGKHGAIEAHGPVGVRDPRKRQDVLDGDSRHYNNANR